MKQTGLLFSTLLPQSESPRTPLSLRGEPTKTPSRTSLAEDSRLTEPPYPFRTTFRPSLHEGRPFSNHEVRVLNIFGSDPLRLLIVYPGLPLKVEAEVVSGTTRGRPPSVHGPSLLLTRAGGVEPFLLPRRVRPSCLRSGCVPRHGPPETPGPLQEEVRK